MMLTEPEARECLCPLTQSNAGAATHVMDANCKASKCMAWRWQSVCTNEDAIQRSQMWPRRQLSFLEAMDG